MYFEKEQIDWSEAVENDRFSLSCPLCEGGHKNFSVLDDDEIDAIVFDLKQ